MLQTLIVFIFVYLFLQCQALLLTQKDNLIDININKINNGISALAGAIE